MVMECVSCNSAPLPPYSSNSSSNSVCRLCTVLFLSQGMLHLGDVVLQVYTTAALNAFQAASKKLHNGRKNHAPQLAQASVYFNLGNISRAHQL